MKKFSFLLTALLLMVFLTANTIYAAEQGLNAKFVKFDLTREDFEFEMAMGISPEELFSDSFILKEVDIIDDTAFFIEDADLRAKGNEILEEEEHHEYSPEQWGIYWEGTLIPAESGSYTFSCMSDNGLLIKIDDTVVIDFWEDNWDVDVPGETIELEAGKKYRVEAWYFDNYGGSYYKVWWAKDGGEKEQIPVSVFTTEIQPKPDPTPTPPSTPTPDPTPTPSQSNPSPSTGSNNASPSATATSGDDVESDAPSPFIFIGIAAAVVIIGVVVFLVVSKKKKA